MKKINQTVRVSQTFLKQFKVEMPETPANGTYGDALKIDLPKPMLVELELGRRKHSQWPAIWGDRSRYVGTIGYLNQITLVLHRNFEKYYWIVSSARIKIKGHRAFIIDWDDWTFDIMKASKGAEPIYKRLTEPESEETNPVDITGNELSVGDHVTFHASHAVRGGSKYFMGIGKITKITSGGTAFVNLFWVPDAWKEKYPANCEKRVKVDRVLKLDDMADQLLILKLSS